MENGWGAGGALIPRLQGSSLAADREAAPYSAAAGSIELKTPIIQDRVR